jgi:hypothetical protein
MTDAGLPFKPGDWATDSSDRIAKVKAIYRTPAIGGSEEEILFDLIMYDWDGEKLGRISEAMGGPRSFEPACSIEGWRRIAQPEFPVSLKWRPSGKGKVTARHWAGETLPPANWTPRRRRSKAIPQSLVGRDYDRLRKALQEIADGHNDPRSLAKEVLGLK